ncbi:MAG: DNA repair protein RadC [Anaerolineaceae bacterium]|nr:DNA repair protein RadC [Anaerolineaceae bacterium]
MPKEIAPGYRITDINQDERPRERLIKHGASGLSTPELLAIIIGSGIPGENAIQIGQRLLVNHKSLSGIYRAGLDALCEEPGIGTARAAQIMAAMEIARRTVNENGEQKPAILSPEDAAALIKFEMSLLEQEELRVMLLDTRYRLIEIVALYKGSLNASAIRIGELFKNAIRKNAAAVIVVHNHPSGDTTASPEDIAMTHEMVKAGELLNVEVVDHLIIGGNRYLSMKNNHIVFK